jgi:hypothetical protein
MLHIVGSLGTDSTKEANMNDVVIAALQATGLTRLAQAYIGSVERLSDIDISDFDAIDFTKISGEQACYLEIVRSCDLLLPFLTRRADSGEGVILGMMTTFERVMLNESADQLLEKFAGTEPEDTSLKFDPEFALSIQIRQALLRRLQVTA